MISFAALDQGSNDEEDNDELTCCFDAPRAPSHADPVDWWFAKKREFPCLYWFVHDIMSIPGKFQAATKQLSLLYISQGSAVAVERVFSGGKDTISLRRARLKPDTIRTLMLVKHHLHLRRQWNNWLEAQIGLGIEGDVRGRSHFHNVSTLVLYFVLVFPTCFSCLQANTIITLPNV
jgi:hypothetical protein